MTKNIIPMEAGIYIIDRNTGFPFSRERQNESIYIGMTKKGNNGFPFSREWQNENTGFPFSREWQNKSIFTGMTK